MHRPQRHRSEGNPATWLSIFVKAQPESDGRFEFAEVPPFEVEVTLEWPPSPGQAMPWSHPVLLEIEPGATHPMVIGGTGRTVVGQVRIEGEVESELNFLRDVHLLTRIPAIPPPAFQRPAGGSSREEMQAAITEYQKRQIAFWQSEEGRQAPADDSAARITSQTIHTNPPARCTRGSGASQCSRRINDRDSSRRSGPGTIVSTAGRFAVNLLAMFTRQQQLPERSFFLFGPRGTGKTTWLRHVLPEALWFDLLRTRTLLELSQRPEVFRQQVEARPRGSWVVVDEVQRVPTLLNEVHALIAEHGRTYRFALSGSSARKLKRLDVNLLAGRAINRQFFPLTAAELDFDFDPDFVLRFGLLPQIRSDPKYATDALEAYAANYLREEIQQEALGVA